MGIGSFCRKAKCCGGGCCTSGDLRNGQMFLQFRKMKAYARICMGKGLMNARGNTCSTFTARVKATLGCNRSGRVLMGASGATHPSIVPIGRDLFKMCKNVCHPI